MALTSSKTCTRCSIWAKRALALGGGTVMRLLLGWGHTTGDTAGCLRRTLRRDRHDLHLPDHRCHDKRRWQYVTSSAATVLDRPQALLRWHAATPLFRRVYWTLPYPLLSAYHRPYKPNYPSIGLFRGGKCLHFIE